MINYQAKVIKAVGIANYFKSNPGARMADAARDLNLNYDAAYKGYNLAVGLKLIKRKKFPKGPQIGHSPETLEKIAGAVALRRQQKSLEVIGQNLGVTRERARQFLRYAVRQGMMCEKEWEHLRYNGRQQKQWAYFIELADQIENINRETYHALVKKHWPSLKSVVKSVGRIEQNCLETLVQNGFVKKNTRLVTWILCRAKRSRVSMSELKEMADEYITTDITLCDLAEKYKIVKKSEVNPSAVAARYLKQAVELNIISREDYNKKARKTVSETWKKIGRMGRKYPEDKVKIAIEAYKRGIPCSEVANVLGMKIQSLYNIIYRNHQAC